MTERKAVLGIVGICVAGILVIKSQSPGFFVGLLVMMLWVYGMLRWHNYAQEKLKEKEMKGGVRSGYGESDRRSYRRI